jgi:hypothetical protein
MSAHVRRNFAQCALERLSDPLARTSRSRRSKDNRDLFWETGALGTLKPTTFLQLAMKLYERWIYRSKTFLKSRCVFIQELLNPGGTSKSRAVRGPLEI